MKIISKLTGIMLIILILITNANIVWAEDIAAVMENNTVTNKATATYAIISENPTVTSSEGYVSYSSNSYYYKGAYSNCSSLDTIVINSGVDYLAAGTLSFINVKKLIFPQSSISYATSGYIEHTGKDCVGPYTIYTYYEYPATFYSASATNYYVSKEYNFTPSGLSGTKVTYDYNDGKCLYMLKDDNTYEVMYAMPGSTSISIPSMIDGISVTSIADEAFMGRNELESLTIPNSITAIGTSAFENCSSLKSILLPSSVASVPARTFYGCASLKSAYLSSKITSIGDFAFYGTGLTSINIPAVVSEIGVSAFSGCKDLSSLKVNSSNNDFISIDNVLFSADKSRLISYASGKADTAYIIPAEVKTIDAQAFTSLSSLTEITIPENITTIGENAFITNNNPLAATVNMNSLASDISLYPLGSAVVNMELDSLAKTFKVSGILNGEGLKSYNIPEKYYEYTCTEIGDSAFSSCTALSEVTIPDTVTRIGNEAFMTCTVLENIVIPIGVTEIGEVCFANDTNLTEIEIPPTVSQLNEFMFFECSAITVTCAKFSSADDISLYPENSVLKYKIWVDTVDVNGDSNFDILDSIAVMNYINNSITPQNIAAADIDNDGDVTSKDVAEILKMLV